MKKLIAVLLTSMLCLSLAACGNSAGEAAPGDDVTEFVLAADPESAEAFGACGANADWYYRNGVLVIKGTGAIRKPASLSDYPWDDYSDDIYRLILSEGITEIPGSMMRNRRNLSRVDFPQSLEKIGDHAFNRTSLETVTVPGGVRVIEDNTFSEINTLTSVTLSEGVEIIREQAFAYCDDLASVTLPASLTEIEENPLWGSEKLATVTYSCAEELLDDIKAGTEEYFERFFERFEEAPPQTEYIKK